MRSYKGRFWRIGNKTYQYVVQVGNWQRAIGNTLCQPACQSEGQYAAGRLFPSRGKYRILVYVVLSLLSIMLFITCTTKREDTYSYINKVNPLIGTAPLTDPDFIGYTPPEGWRVWAGLVFPGVSLPNAMVQLSPITEFGSGAGYEYEDSMIYGFAHTNKGHWNLCHIPVLPIAGEVDEERYGSRFSHDAEKAMPGYYRVLLKDYDINAELTSTLRCGFHRYEFPEDQERKVVFNLARSNERVRDWHIDQTVENAVSGYQNTGRNKVFFYAVFNEEISQIKKHSNTKGGLSVLHFKADNKPLEMKIGLSFVSKENAQENLEKEIAERSFEEIRKEAWDLWESHLSKIKVTGGTDKQQIMFYSSLYRSFLWPALRSDVNGEYRDVKGNTAKADFNYYTIPSFWDTYRNKLVLLGMLSPDVTNDVIKSLIDIGDKTGFIPTFFHGDHAAAFIAGSYLRGIDDYDIRKVYELLIRNATIEGGARPHIKEYMEKGYISTPEINDPNVETRAKAGVTKTLEYAYDDYAIALLADELNDPENHRLFKERAQYYKNVFDASSGFMRGRLENGSWVKDFNPKYPYYEYMYREANAWQSTFFVPHDVKGLIGLYGGPENMERKLDSLFTIPWDPEHIARNVSSFIGQYCHGNQPAHSVPYMYYYLDKQEKAQHLLDTIMNHYYGVGEEGLALCGMDDAGEMSSWYVFNAMGFYPFSPADDDYIVTVPLFDEVQWTINGKKILMKKSGQGRVLDAIKINGEIKNGYFISHNLFLEGGTIEVSAK